MKYFYVAGGLLLGGITLIGALAYVDFFKLFSPQDLARWEQEVAPSLSEPPIEPFDVATPRTWWRRRRGASRRLAG